MPTRSATKRIGENFHGAMFARGVQEVLGSKEIMNLLPHRYPFLMVDKIAELEIGKRAVGLKNVSQNEPYFEGHFPGQPTMPAVLILEAMAQVGAVALLSSRDDGKLPLFTGVDRARFRRVVRPGDQLVVEVVLERLRGFVGKGKAVAKVGDDVVAEAELMFALVDRDSV